MEKPVFGPDFFRELAIENPLGVELSEEDAEAWWHWIAWPAYKTHRYKDHKRAVRNWWARLTFTELTRAREARARAELQEAQLEQEEMDEAYFDACDQFGKQEMVGALRVIMGGKK